MRHAAQCSGATRREIHSKGSAGLGASGQAQLLQLLAQGPAIDSQNTGSAALVSFRIVQYHAEQRLFDLAQHEIVQMRWPVTIQAGEVVAQCSFSVIAQRQFSAAQPDTGVPPGSTLLFCCHVRSPQSSSTQAQSSSSQAASVSAGPRKPSSTQSSRWSCA